MLGAPSRPVGPHPLRTLTQDLLTTLLGLALLLGGGDVMVRGASALAHRLGVSPLAIGLTVVAFGTSAPELAVNITAAFLGNGEISFGNIIGSNMANIGVIVGCHGDRSSRCTMQSGVVIAREIPMMLLATDRRGDYHGLRCDGCASRPRTSTTGPTVCCCLMFFHSVPLLHRRRLRSKQRARRRARGGIAVNADERRFRSRGSQPR